MAPAYLLYADTDSVILHINQSVVDKMKDEYAWRCPVVFYERVENHILYKWRRGHQLGVLKAATKTFLNRTTYEHIVARWVDHI